MDQAVKALAVVVGVVLLGIAVVAVAKARLAGQVCSSCGVAHDRSLGEWCEWCVDWHGEQPDGGESR